AWAACKSASAWCTRVRISSLSRSTSTSPAFTASPASLYHFLTMPLALDLIAALVIGVILPVATTFLARVSRLTSPTLDLSMTVPPLLAAIRIRSIRTPAAIPPETRTIFLLFFLPFPFAMGAAPRQIFGHCSPMGYARRRRKVPNQTKNSSFSICRWLDLTKEEKVSLDFLTVFTKQDLCASLATRSQPLAVFGRRTCLHHPESETTSG